MQCCSHQCYFRPTNSSAFQCMVTVVFKYQRHFLLPITAQLEAAPHPTAACCSTACLQPTSEPCRLSYQSPTEVWVLLGTLLLLGCWQWPSSASHHHNTPVLVETISWLRHTKAAALFGNRLLKRSWEQPQTATLQQNLKHSLSLAFLSATRHKERSILGESSQTGVRQTDPLGTQL